MSAAKVLSAVDIGTNTVRLLVVEYEKGKMRDILRKMEITRLGEGVDETNKIKKEAMQRTLEALTDFQQDLKNLGVNNYRAVATSAMRDALNAQEFIELVRNKIGLEIEVIAGEEEARLTFNGACSSTICDTRYSTLVVDVGGGSTEFIYGKAGEVFGVSSLNIGSVRLTERFFKHDPPTDHELCLARELIQETAALTFEHILESKPATIIAVAGTATQLAALKYEVEPYDAEKIHGSIIKLNDLDELLNKLTSMPLEKRKNLKGMHPKRADVIIAGALILQETLLELGYPMLVVSEKDILNGIILSISENSGL